MKTTAKTLKGLKKLGKENRKEIPFKKLKFKFK